MLHKHRKSYNSYFQVQKCFITLTVQLEIIEPDFISLTSIAPTPEGVWNLASSIRIRNIQLLCLVLAQSHCSQYQIHRFKLLWGGLKKNLQYFFAVHVKF